MGLGLATALLVGAAFAVYTRAVPHSGTPPATLWLHKGRLYRAVEGDREAAFRAIRGISEPPEQFGTGEQYISVMSERGSWWSHLGLFKSFDGLSTYEVGPVPVETVSGRWWELRWSDDDP
jgi:hypothetical protein